MGLHGLVKARAHVVHRVYVQRSGHRGPYTVVDRWKELCGSSCSSEDRIGLQRAAGGDVVPRIKYLQGFSVETVQGVCLWRRRRPRRRVHPLKRYIAMHSGQYFTVNDDTYIAREPSAYTGN